MNQDLEKQFNKLKKSIQKICGYQSWYLYNPVGFNGIEFKNVIIYHLQFMPIEK